MPLIFHGATFEMLNASQPAEILDRVSDGGF
jgi:hypothetical protein